MTRPRNSAPAVSAVRPPRQHRSRLAWQRVLDAGVVVLAEGRAARFNVSAVCERAGVAVTAVYSRVDSRDALLHAVYEHGVAAVQRTEGALAREITRADASAAVEMLVTVFDRHGPFLSAAVLGAAEDGYMKARGGENLRAARAVFVRAAAGERADPGSTRRAQSLFTAAFSALAFDAAFGSELLHPGAADGTLAELRILTAALFPATSSFP